MLMCLSWLLMLNQPSWLRYAHDHSCAIFKFKIQHKQTLNLIEYFCFKMQLVTPFACGVISHLVPLSLSGEKLFSQSESASFKTKHLHSK